MAGTREKKREETQGAIWLGAMLDLLRFGALGAAVALAVLGVAAALISFGAIGNNRGDSVVIAASLLGGLIGGLFAVGRRKGASLPTGLGVGAVLFLLLLTAGMLLYDSVPTLRSAGAIAGACLCGSGLSGVLAGKPKKKRRK